MNNNNDILIKYFKEKGIVKIINEYRKFFIHYEKFKNIIFFIKNINYDIDINRNFMIYNRSEIRYGNKTVKYYYKNELFIADRIIKIDNMYFKSYREQIDIIYESFNNYKNFKHNNIDFRYILENDRNIKKLYLNNYS